MMKRIKISVIERILGALVIFAILSFPVQALAGKNKGGGGANAPEITSVLIDQVEGDMFIYGFRLWTDDCPDVKLGGELLVPAQCSGVDPQEQAILVPLPVAPPLEDGSHLLEVSGDNGEDQFEVALGKGGCSIEGTIVFCDDGSASDVEGPQGEQGPEGPVGPIGAQGPAGEDGSVIFPPINTGNSECEDGAPCDNADGIFGSGIISSTLSCNDPDDIILNGGCQALGFDGAILVSEPVFSEPAPEWRCVVRGSSTLRMNISCLDLDGDGAGS